MNPAYASKKRPRGEGEPTSSPAGDGGGSGSAPRAKAAAAAAAPPADDADDVPLVDKGSTAYVPYVPSLPAAVGPVGAHPDAVVETGALSAVAAPALTLLPALPVFVYRPPGHRDRELAPSVAKWLKFHGGGGGGGSSSSSAQSPPHPALLPARLSAPQLEAVLRAAQAHMRLLPGGRERLGFMLADQPGMGKGRCIAASFLDFRARWGVAPRGLWVSVSRDLLVDAGRDMRDIVGGDAEYTPRGGLPFKASDYRQVP